MTSSSSSSGDYGNHPVDRMYASQRHIAQGTHAVQDLSNACCHEEGKVGAVAGAIILGGVFTAIPPPGVFTIVGAALGGFLGGAIGESCNNGRKRNED